MAGHARGQGRPQIVSPTIIHKTEVGGVRIVPKTPDKVRSAVRRMLSEVPERYAEWIERHRPAPPYRAGRGGRAALQNAIASDLKGCCRCSSCRPTPKRSAMSLSWACAAPASSAWSSAPASAGPIRQAYAERFRKAGHCSRTHDHDRRRDVLPAVPANRLI